MLRTHRGCYPVVRPQAGDRFCLAALPDRIGCGRRPGFESAVQQWPGRRLGAPAGHTTPPQAQVQRATLCGVSEHLSLVCYSSVGGYGVLLLVRSMLVLDVAVSSRRRRVLFRRLCLPPLFNAGSLWPNLSILTLSSVSVRITDQLSAADSIRQLAQTQHRHKQSHLLHQDCVQSSRAARGEARQRNCQIWPTHDGTRTAQHKSSCHSCRPAAVRRSKLCRVEAAARQLHVRLPM